MGSIHPYPYPKQIEKNKNGSEDDDVTDEDISGEDVVDEDIAEEDVAHLSDGEIEVDVDPDEDDNLILDQDLNITKEEMSIRNEEIRHGKSLSI